MVFPESDTPKKSSRGLRCRKFTQAELEKLLLMTVLSLGTYLYWLLPLFWTLIISNNCILDLAIHIEDSNYLIIWTSSYTSYLHLSTIPVLNRRHSKMASTQECLLLHPQNLYLRLYVSHFLYPLTSATPFNPQGATHSRPVVSPVYAVCCLTHNAW